MIPERRIVIDDRAAVKSWIAGMRSVHGKLKAQNSRITIERLIIVRAGHVITANGTDQLAAARFEPPRADRTVPRRIFGPVCRMLEILQRCRGLHCSLYRLTEDLVCLPLRGAFHGWTVITHSVAREKLGRRQ